MAKVRLDVARAIPNPDYDSIAIIDLERWRPLFDLNWSSRNVYKQYSTKLVMEQYPTLNHNTATYGKTLKLKHSACACCSRPLPVR